MKKSFLLRIDEETFDKVKDISEVEERSINYMLCKLISKGLNRINLDESIEKDIEDYYREKRRDLEDAAVESLDTELPPEDEDHSWVVI